MEELSKSLDAFDEWRNGLIKAVKDFIDWVEKVDGTDLEILSLYENLQALKDDRLTVAMVGEFSRGKTELINAIFFGDYTKRLLPSSPGRTTMCPAEIAYDPKIEPCIRLLPIETKSESRTLQQLRKDDSQWTKIALNVDSEDAMAVALKELVKDKKVSIEQASKLGFDLPKEMIERARAEGVDVPNWRHALINFPHPLLKNGLTIIDTPGLNALGSEPELTLRILAQCQAVVFVLAAETGVTQSDMQVWAQHVCVATRSNAKSRIVVLNKIDTLWDELLTEKEIKSNVMNQLTETARLLRHPAQSVFPVSAAKGLIAKFRRDGELLKKSGIDRLENTLSTQVVPAKAQIMRDGVVEQVKKILDMVKSQTSSNVRDVKAEIAELDGLRGKSEGVIRGTIEALEEEKASFDKQVKSFGKIDAQLKKEMLAFLDALDPERHDKIFEESRQVMKKSLTTRSLKSNMAKLFKEIEYSMKRAEAQSQRIRGHIDKSYKAFHTDHSMPRMKPSQFNTKRYLLKLDALLQDAEAYRNSTELMMTEQNTLVQKFMVTMVSHMRQLLAETHDAAKKWAASVLNPIKREISKHKETLDDRLENLTKLKSSQLDIDERVKALNAEIAEQEAEMQQLHSVLQRIQQSAVLPGAVAEQAAKKTA